MKKFKIAAIFGLLLIFVLSLAALSACSGDAVVSFDISLEGISCADVVADGSGKISEPSLGSDVKVFGWYRDKALTQPFDFSSDRVSGDTTLYLAGMAGNGSEENPYQINCGEALKFLACANETTQSVVVITRDFSYATEVSSDYLKTVFDGSLDGAGHTINLGSENNTTGIFYKLGENAVVKNLVVTGHIDAAVGSCGVVANHNYGTVSNVVTYGTELHSNTSGTVSNGYANGIYSVLGTVGNKKDAVSQNDSDAVAGAGGIVGTNYVSGVVSDCYNNMNVRAVVGGGGIAAVNYGTISDCFNNGCVGTTGDTASNMLSEFDFSYLGGITGLNYGTVTQCGNLNKVYAQRLPWLFNDDNNYSMGYTNYRMNIGGIVGDNIAVKSDTDEYIGGIITECFNFGRIHGDMRVGGIAGQSNGYIADCYSYCKIGARHRLGSIVGYQKDDDYGVVTRCVGMCRISSSQSGEIVDESGISYTVEALEDGKISSKTDTISEYYVLAKYADHCVYHNNCGNIAPVDPTAEDDESTNINTTAAGVADKISTLTNESWVVDATISALVGLNSSYQVYLYAHLSWQEVTVTAVVDGTETEVKALAGINVFDILPVSGGKYVASVNRNMSGYTANILPSVDVPAGKKLIWTTEKDNAESVWDGVVRGNITIYSMLVNE